LIKTQNPVLSCCVVGVNIIDIMSSLKVNPVPTVCDRKDLCNNK